MASYQYVYVMKQLGKTYPGGKQVLKDIWLSFLPGVKIGVIGLNGAGKSTLLKIMAGLEKEFTGEAWAADGARVGYLPLPLPLPRPLRPRATISMARVMHQTWSPKLVREAAEEQQEEEQGMKQEQLQEG